MILLKTYVLFIRFLGVDPRECDGGVSAAGPDLSPWLWTGSPAGPVVLRHRAEFCHLY